MNRKSRERIEFLERRLEYLNNRINQNPDKDLTFDKQEYGALKWGIEIIKYFVNKKE